MDEISGEMPVKNREGAPQKCGCPYIFQSEDVVMEAVAKRLWQGSFGFHP